MYTQDFIKRMINQIVAALQLIIGLKAAGQYRQALQAIDQALEQLLGLKADLINRLDDQTILNSLTHDRDLDTDRLLLLAELFKEQGDVLAAQKRLDQSFSSHLRALNFYIEVALRYGPEELPEPDGQLLDLFYQMGKFQLPHQTLYGLFVYFEKRGRFAQADSILSRLANDPSLADEVHQESQEFYLRLLNKTDAELMQGDMPRAEVERRLATFS